VTLITEPQHSPRSKAFLATIAVVALLAFAGFIALGIWQVQRLAWKHELIARVEHRVHAEPSPLPGVVAWRGLSRESAEYLRVSFRGQFFHGRETLVQASTELGSGYWVLTPLRTEQGYWLLVNRGFVSPEWRERWKRKAQEPNDLVELRGLLRWSEPGGRLWQKNDAAQGRWYSRDVPAIIASQRLGASPAAPYFVDLEAAPASTDPDFKPPAEGVWPRPGLTVLRFADNHLVYAITWFSLAAMVAGALAYLVADERRLRRLSPSRRQSAAGHEEPSQG
jgi:surfeit locus 1 family protein